MSEVKFKVFRFDPEKEKRHRFEEYAVPVNSGMTVLDGLYYIQEHIDGSLAFRSSCRAGVCGSCAMHINGTYRLACETQVKDLGSTIKVRPLAHLPVMKDLFVDMDPFWEKFKQIKPYLIPGDEPGEKERLQTPDERARLDVIIDCILCAACYGSCTINNYDEEYLGPAALLKAQRFFSDTRDHAHEERLDLVDGDHGAWRCHTIFNCQQVCPKDIDITGSIGVLKRHLMARRLSPSLKKA
ncbi:MAG TPA: succinate dehydrogenase iron-sulfur subunit [bacterium]|nr:succinate dehydrogenase iron-sulfur subunit [bacterium]